MRVVFDTNIYISALVNPGGKAEQALNRCIDGRDHLLISKPILEETLRVLADKFSRDREQLARVAVFLDELCEVIGPQQTINLLSDEPDNRILECAVAGKADCVITGDNAMLKLGEHAGVSLLSLRQYLELAEC